MAGANIWVDRKFDQSDDHVSYSFEMLQIQAIYLPPFATNLYNYKNIVPCVPCMVVDLKSSIMNNNFSVHVIFRTLAKVLALSSQK